MPNTLYRSLPMLVVHLSQTGLFARATEELARVDPGEVLRLADLFWTR
jgi:hypothetical protein